VPTATSAETKPTPSPKAAAVPATRVVDDACSLITRDEVTAVQGSPIKDTKNSERSDGGFRVCQCFYTAEEFSRSVSFTVTQRDPAKGSNWSPKDYWKTTFGRYENDEHEQDRDKEKKESPAETGQHREEEEKSAPPRKVPGIGDQAFWSSNRVGGVLYVLKGDAFIRVSIGGADSDEGRLEKSKALAAKALARL
jgi:hypothetical protein